MDIENNTLREEELQQVAGGADVLPAGEPYDAAAVLERAIAEIGKPYGFGAVGPEAYDCSGLVSYAVSGTHVRLFTTSSLLGCPRVADPVPGDICVSGSHCGIYVGGGQMVHAPSFGTMVNYGPVQGGMIFVRP